MFREIISWERIPEMRSTYFDFPNHRISVLVLGEVPSVPVILDPPVISNFGHSKYLRTRLIPRIKVQVATVTEYIPFALWVPANKTDRRGEDFLHQFRVATLYGLLILQNTPNKLTEIKAPYKIELCKLGY